MINIDALINIVKRTTHGTAVTYHVAMSLIHDQAIAKIRFPCHGTVLASPYASFLPATARVADRNCQANRRPGLQ